MAASIGYFSHSRASHPFGDRRGRIGFRSAGGIRRSGEELARSEAHDAARDTLRREQKESKNGMPPELSA
jgi:hypothetical protein